MSDTYKITEPSQTNVTFAKIFNEGRNVDAWVSLHEPERDPVRRPYPGRRP